MKNFNKILLQITLVGLVAVVFTQCASQQNATGISENGKKGKGAPEYVLQKSGAQLWAESCIRCHNTASPATFSDTEWDVAVKHMELRAQLTRVEAEKVLEFMQTAN